MRRLKQDNKTLVVNGQSPGDLHALNQLFMHNQVGTSFYFATAVLLMHINRIILSITDRASFKDFSVEGPPTKRDVSEKRKCGDVWRWGGWGSSP